MCNCIDTLRLAASFRYHQAMAFATHAPLLRAASNSRAVASPRRPRIVKTTTTNITMEIPIGSKVRVKTAVEMYHVPNHRNEPFDVVGLEGVVSMSFIETWGKESTATKPYQVKFVEPKFMAHFDEDELEVIE